MGGRQAAFDALSGTPNAWRSLVIKGGEAGGGGADTRITDVRAFANSLKRWTARWSPCTSDGRVRVEGRRKRRSKSFKRMEEEGSEKEARE